MSEFDPEFTRVENDSTVRVFFRVPERAIPGAYSRMVYSGTPLRDWIALFAALDKLGLPDAALMSWSSMMSPEGPTAPGGSWRHVWWSKDEVERELAAQAAGLASL